MNLEEIDHYINNTSVPLFKCDTTNPLKAVFDNKGFDFTTEAKEKYAIIQHKPHLYVAYTLTKEGFHYVGKSNQQGGRWKRSHAYHLGTLAYHLIDSIQKDDQNHLHWIDKWMDINSKQVDILPFSILLKERVFIAFVPFQKYSNCPIEELTKQDISNVNSLAETLLIEHYEKKGFIMLNKKKGRKVPNRCIPY